MRRIKGLEVTTSIFLILISALMGFAKPNLPDVNGFIVWTSNRDGDWEIFRMNLDGTDRKQLTRNNSPDTTAKISPDGRMIAWTRERRGRREVWVMNADGSNQHKVVSNASMGIWLSRSEIVIFRGRNEVETYVHDLKSGSERRIWPPKGARLRPREVRGATPSLNGRYFVGWSPNPRGTWIFSSDGRFQKHIHGGCEGHFAPDGSFVYWVMSPGTFGKASLKGEISGELYKVDQNKMWYGHTYFPQLSPDMRYLVYGACPNNQHDHNTSDYEIFLMRMKGLKPAWSWPLRLTYHPKTDRWPDIFIQGGKGRSRERVRSGLIALYAFTEGKGTVVHDISGVNPPLNLRIKDPKAIRWIKGDNGVEFVKSSMIISEGGAEKLLRKLRSTGKLSIEVWVQPANLRQTGPSRIVSMSKDPLNRDFTLGQIKSDIAYRLRTTKTNPNGIPELDTTSRVLDGGVVHLVATYDGRVKHLYVNGVRHPESQRMSGDFRKWNSFPLIIGNEATGDRTWLGKVFLVAIYDRPLRPDEVMRNYRAGWRIER
ncbi:TPA: hypothetical protein ENG04_11400 [Candidatus Poribacteria bacterium]|nr:hypothetical protein [Candidatus Poribacteria bacterium]HEX30675.1 hypothetical protein [Candidatus Poribacteria bacterium]